MLDNNIKSAYGVLMFVANGLYPTHEGGTLWTSDLLELQARLSGRAPKGPSTKNPDPTKNEYRKGGISPERESTV